MTTEKKTGNVALILAALATMKHIVLDVSKYAPHHTTVRVFTDMSAYRALMAQCDAEREKLLYGRERDNVLCRYQMRADAMGTRFLSLGSNIYGWAIHDIMGSNIRGGRASITPRGWDLAQCIAHGCELAQAKNVEFSFGLNDIPTDHNDIVEAIIGMAAERHTAHT